ncbi:MAG: HlyD family efflux transporter periplasmic adaptor subunit [Desulfovibrionaceae bacterium]|nr:HlyD family efflux transporter periplasmic adaptor subunit [Desulfovibrionaceae bacterium]
MSDSNALSMPAIVADPQKRQRAILIACILLLLAAILVFIFWSKKTITSQYALVDGMVYTVSSEVSAPLLDLAVVEGGRVRKGDVVARMDAHVPAPKQDVAPKENVILRFPTMEEVDKRMRGAKEAENEAIARLALTRREEEAKQRAMEDAVLAHVQSELRMRSIAASGGASSAEYRQAAAREESARKRMEKAKEDFEASSLVRAALSQELNRIHQEVMEAKRIASQYRYSARPAQPSEKRAPALVNVTVAAPVDGTVMKVSAKPGDRIEAGDPLFLIIPEGSEQSLWIKAWFPLSAKSDIQGGMACAVEKNADGRAYEGRVESLLPPEPLPKGQGQEGIDFLPVRIRLSDSSGLLPGDAVLCRIQTSIF